MFVTGKGGVGKTAVSLALGRSAADAGKRVIVCELSGQSQAAEILRVDASDYTEVDAGGGLHAISIDPDNATREYLEHRLPMRAMSAVLNRSKLFSYLAAATPGLAEMVALGKVWELAGSERRVAGAEPYDLVVVDSPATGHGVGFLQTPRNFAEIARVGPLAEQAAIIDRGICNPKRTGVAVVATGEEMAVSEALELERTFAETLGITVEALIANAIVPGRLSDTELQQLERVAEEPQTEGHGSLSAVATHEHRAAAGRSQLERLRREGEAGVIELPMLFEPELSPESIAQLAGLLR